MRIEHIAIWTKDIEKLKAFYMTYFNAKSGSKYTNPQKGFQSYFLSFDDGAMLEIMQIPNIPDNKNDPVNQSIGLNHIAISAGSEDSVVKITDQLRENGYKVVSEPRHTGDGYFESCVFDPDNNRIEITI
jgi:lactoylglutathione lyase